MVPEIQTDFTSPRTTLGAGAALHRSRPSHRPPLGRADASRGIRTVPDPRDILRLRFLSNQNPASERQVCGYIFGSEAIRGHVQDTLQGQQDDGSSLAKSHADCVRERMEEASSRPDRISFGASRLCFPEAQNRRICRRVLLARLSGTRHEAEIKPGILGCEARIQHGSRHKGGQGPQIVRMDCSPLLGAFRQEGLGKMRKENSEGIEEEIFTFFLPGIE